MGPTAQEPEALVTSWEELVATVQTNDIYRMTRPNQSHIPYWSTVSYVKIWPGNCAPVDFSGGELFEPNLGIGADHELKPGGVPGSLPIMKSFFEEEGFVLERIVDRPEGMKFSYE